MKSLLMLLAVLLFHDVATAQKKMDKRILIESAGKTQIKDEADKYNAIFTDIEIFKIEIPINDDN
jgi:hypothetical protein